MKKIANIYIFLFAFLLFSGLLLFVKYFTTKEPDYQKICKTFIDVLHKKEIEAASILDKVIDDIKQSPNASDITHYSFYENVFIEKGIAILILKNDSLKYWSSNIIPVEEILNDSVISSKIYNFSNGWYEVKEKQFVEYTIKSVILIRNKYHYQNDYLINEFQKDFPIKDCRLYPYKGEYNIYAKNGDFLCSLFFKKTKTASPESSILLMICFIFAYLFCILLLIKFLRIQLNKIIGKAFWIPIIAFCILAFRFALFKFKLPIFIYALDIFSPKYYASFDFLPSLGDLFLNILTIFIVSIFIFVNLRNVTIAKTLNIFPKIIISFILFLCSSFLFLFTYFILKGLIIHSNIEFDLSNVFGVDYFSLIGFCIIGLLLLTFFLISYTLSKFSLSICKNINLFFIITIIELIGISAALIYHDIIDIQYIIFFILFLLILGFYIHKDNGKFKLQSLIIYIVLFAFFATYCIYENISYKEKEKRKLMASQLALEHDPKAEYLFNDVKNKISNDTIIQNEVNAKEPNEALITERIQLNYMNGYWSKYNVQITLCKPKQTLLIKPENIKTDCDSFFTQMIQNLGVATDNPDLFFLNTGNGRNSYISRISYNNKSDTSSHLANLYMELYSKFIPKELGYPELLINKDIKINRDIYNYSYAKYKDKYLILQYGKFNYFVNSNAYSISNQVFYFFDKDNYNHLFYKIDANTSLIISKKSASFFDIIAPFSYIFVLFCLIVLLLAIVLNFPIHFKELNLNFKTRIQIAMMLVLVLSFIIIGISTLYYIINIYNKKNVDNITEKAHSIMIEIENKLGNNERFTTENADEVGDILVKFSNVFFTDINMYTLDGNLVASSRPQIFNEGMISKKMNTEAFFEMNVNKNTLFIHEESIGKLKYSSAYIPFRNNNGNISGYINLPYFAKQSELRKELSNFFIALLNINVILTALAIIIALIVSNYITRPMKIIIEKLGQIRLGKKNEKIIWTRSDEIGGLIKEYNRMLDELAESAEMLAKSERESAWREMAKQVAHEIKNPLTPMKLSIQHLRKTWEEKTPDWDERFKRFSITMVEQIESLSKIATEFSDFALMPKANHEEIDITLLIDSAIALFQNNKITFHFNKPSNKKLSLNADKTQLLRVLNNLIKNACQALSESKNPHIDISLEDRENSIMIKIADNGSGINEEQKNKIFSPNFTTKTGGTGLGLAMVKSIIESYNGKIFFESEAGFGTTFYVELPTTHHQSDI